MGSGGQRHNPAAFPQERSGSYCVGGWVGPKAILEGCGKSPPPPPRGFDPRTVHPVASRYTDCAVPAHYQIILSQINKILLWKGQYMRILVCWDETMRRWVSAYRFFKEAVENVGTTFLRIVRKH
jgi:hypothetical protein